MQIEYFLVEVLPNNSSLVVLEILQKGRDSVMRLHIFLDRCESAFVEVKLGLQRLSWILNFENRAEALELFLPIGTMLSPRIESFKGLDIFAGEVGTEPARQPFMLGHFFNELFLDSAALVVEAFTIVVVLSMHIYIFKNSFDALSLRQESTLQHAELLRRLHQQGGRSGETPEIEHASENTDRREIQTSVTGNVWHLRSRWQS